MKKIIIAFPCEWVAYSPTILNLVDLLKDYAKVQVVAIDNGKYNNSALPDNFSLLRISPWFFKFLALLGMYRRYKLNLLIRFLQKYTADIAIGVDAAGMHAVQNAYGKGHFLSLEIERNGLFLKLNQKAIQSIVIQSRERLNYLYPENFPKCKVFYLPNGPVYRNTATPQRKRLCKFDTIFLGNVLPSHGIYQCIDAVETLSDTSITVKGSLSTEIKKKLEKRYCKLIQEKRLIIDSSYTPQAQLLEFLQGFDVGFCFYDFNLIKSNDFNYLSSPSGKMYNYFSAGIPVIGSDIIGLKPVEDFNVGILLSNISVSEIRNAITIVNKNHVFFQENCKHAAQALDFAPPALSYIDFILNETRPSLNPG